MASHMYRGEVATWKMQGVDFGSYLYVPETDQTTEHLIHERGDHNHILKRIAVSTRELRYTALSPRHFDEALLDRVRW